VLYGCLQSLFKYVPKYDFLLAEIAAAVPAALFVFLEGKPAYLTDITRTRLERAFAEIGLEASRHLLFLPRTDRAGYLNLQRQMDILVDSVGWSGGNTSISGIEAGVPIVTLPGEFMRGRHTSAMLHLIGVHDLIAASHEDFVAKLVELGRDAEVRRHAAERISAGSPLLYRDRAVIDRLDSFFKSLVQ
jgi:predicted O-linked N-acetylglucosamine transferase (SPINDLY family)